MAMLLVVALFTLSTLVIKTRGQVKSLEYTTSEEIPSKTTLGNIAQDAGLHKIYSPDIMQQLVYSIVNEGKTHDSLFTITNGGLLKTSGVLNREELCLHVLRCDLSFTIKVGPVRYFQIIKVTVLLTDVNDNTPIFPNETITRFMAETSMPDSIFSIPAARDRDSLPFGIIRYELTSDDHFFSLLQTNATLVVDDLHVVLKARLDRETQENHTFKVTAFDGGIPSLSTSMSVKVVVLDSNDNSPIFVKDSYHVTVREDVLPSTKIIQVAATDLDSQQNAEIIYSFSSRTLASSGQMFTINNLTGEIYVSGELDYETARSYTLTIMARNINPGRAPGVTNVRVDISDVNDSPPIINFYSADGNRVEISEYIHPGDFVAHVTVRDLDSGAGGNFTCSLSSPAFILHRLLTTDFKIIANRSFDREFESQVNLTLICSDEGTPPLTSSLTVPVTIRDENDNKPHFLKSTYHAKLVENSPVGTLLLQVQATDHDVGVNSNITYSMDESKRKYFNLDSKSGNLTTKAVFDFERTKQIKFNVLATDYGEPPLSEEAIIIINIIDMDDSKPVFSKSVYSFPIKENMAAGTLVGTVNATDADAPPFNRFFYVVDPFHNDSDVINVDATSGVVTTQLSLDRETRANYSINVLAVTQASYQTSTATATINIEVLDVNDNAPYFIFPSFLNNSIIISGNAKIGDKLGQLVAMDLDIGINARLAYSILTEKANVLENVIRVEKYTGYLILARSLEKSSKSYTVQVGVRDNGVPAKTAKTLLDVDISYTAPPVAETKSTGTHDTNMVILICIGVIAGVVIVGLVLIITVLCCRHNSKSKITRPATPTEMNSDPSSENSEDSPPDGDVYANRETLLRQSSDNYCNSEDDPAGNTMRNWLQSHPRGPQNGDGTSHHDDEYRLRSSFPLIYQGNPEHRYFNSERMLQKELPHASTPTTRHPNACPPKFYQPEEIELQLRNLDRHAYTGVPIHNHMQMKSTPCRDPNIDYPYTGFSDQSLSDGSRHAPTDAENFTPNRKYRKKRSGHYLPPIDKKTIGESESSLQNMEQLPVKLNLLRDSRYRPYRAEHFPKESELYDVDMVHCRSLSDSGVDHNSYREKPRRCHSVSPHPWCKDNDSGVSADITSDTMCSTSTVDDTQQNHVVYPACTVPVWRTKEQNTDSPVLHYVQDRGVLANPAIFVDRSYNQPADTRLDLVQDWLDYSNLQHTASPFNGGHMRTRNETHPYRPIRHPCNSIRNTSAFPVIPRKRPKCSDCCNRCDDIYEDEEFDSSSCTEQHSDVNDTDVIANNEAHVLYHDSDVTGHNGTDVHTDENCVLDNHDIGYINGNVTETIDIYDAGNEEVISRVLFEKNNFTDLDRNATKQVNPLADQRGADSNRTIEQVDIDNKNIMVDSQR